jgi:hypothetical protein
LLQQITSDGFVVEIKLENRFHWKTQYVCGSLQWERAFKTAYMNIKGKAAAQRETIKQLEQIVSLICRGVHFGLVNTLLDANPRTFMQHLFALGGRTLGVSGDTKGT